MVATGGQTNETPTGYESELRKIIDAAREHQANVVFITTDVHFASVFRYTPYDDFSFHEVVTGPMNAAVFATRLFDETFSPQRLFWHGPRDDGVPRDGDARSWEEAKDLFNYGEISVGRGGRLTLSVRGLSDEPLFETTLAPN